MGKKKERKSEKRDLVASVDINSPSPELEGALPRPEMRGELLLNIFEIKGRQRKHSYAAFLVVTVVGLGFDYNPTISNHIDMVISM